MKILIAVVLCFSFITGFSQSSGVEFTFKNDGIEASYVFGGNFYNPIGPVTWTDNDGIILQNCNSLCDLYIPNIKPGRYCITIQANAVVPGVCDSEFGTITKCLDLEGVSCPELTGSMSASDITCMQDDSGEVSWDGQLAPCLQDNAQFTWSNGDANRNNEPPMTSLTNLVPGKYCVKITPFNNEGQYCDCEGYFCTEIGAVEAQPLAIEADVEPIIMCIGKYGQAIGIDQKGFISIYTTGGIGQTILNWTHNLSGSDTGTPVPINDNIQSVYKYCATATDECGSVVSKCFEIPIVYTYCFKDDQIIRKFTDDTVDISEDSLDFEFVESQLRSTKAAKPQNVKIFPNPAYENITLKFDSHDTQKHNMILYSSSGVSVMNSEFDLGSDSNKVDLNISMLASGVYYVNINGYFVQKLIIIK